MIGRSNARPANAYGSAQRGVAILYRTGQHNSCPGCGQSQWLVGRHTAECAFCATALPLSTSGRYYRPPEFTVRAA